MIKTTQKIVLLVFLLNSSIYSMKGIVHSLLAQKIASQRRFFHPSVGTKCSHVPLVMIPEVVVEETKVAEDVAMKAAVSDPCAKTDGEETSSTHTHSGTEGFGSAIVFTDHKQSDVSYGSSKPHWQNNVTPSPHNHILSDHARMQIKHHAHMAVMKKFEQVTTAYFAQMKVNVSNYEQSFAMRVLDKAAKITASHNSLSLDEILDKKDALYAERESLEKEHESFLQNNPKVCHPYSEYRYGWEAKDYCDALKDLQIRCAIEAITHAIGDCDKKLVEFGKDCEKSFCNNSSDVLENEVIRDLIAKKESIEHSIGQTTQALSCAEKELALAKR